MMLNRWQVLAVVAVAFAGGFAARGVFAAPGVRAAAADQVFELRTYTAAPGKFSAFESRFRDHVLDLLKKHGITTVGLWRPIDAPLSESTLISVVAHPSREAAAKSWSAFASDPAWVKVKAESEKEGPLSARAESVFMSPVGPAAAR